MQNPMGAAGLEWILHRKIRKGEISYDRREKTGIRSIMLKIQK